MPKNVLRRPDGQVLVGVLLLLLLMTIMVPLLVLYTQREARWTEKENQSTTAFHLAEAGIEKGFRVLTTSTKTWEDLTSLGTPISGFQFDAAYADVAGGSYAVSITSGPQKRQATVISVGRDRRGKEVRSLKVVYGQNTLDDVALHSVNGVRVGGGTVVHWGSIISNNPLVTDSRTSPQFHTSSSIDVDANGNAPANCDSPGCCQWFSYATDIPPAPKIDINLYRSSAQATSTYYSTAQSWSNEVYTGGGTVFVENNLTIGSPGIEILGNLIVTGNLSTSSGNWGKGSATIPVPQTAWRQYCNNWSSYRSTFDGSAPASFPGLDSSYLSSSGLTYTPSPSNKFAVRGFLYVGGNFSISGGGGGSYIHGAMFVQGFSTMTASSGVTLFYNEEAAANIKTTSVILSRVSWQDSMYAWPF